MQTRHSSKLTTDLTNAQSSCGWSLLQYCGLCPIVMIHGRLARFSFAFCNYHNKFPTIINGYGLFTLPDLDIDSNFDSDCKSNGSNVPQRTFHTDVVGLDLNRNGSFTLSASVNTAMTLVLLLWLKTIESFQIGVATHFRMASLHRHRDWTMTRNMFRSRKMLLVQE